MPLKGSQSVLLNGQINSQRKQGKDGWAPENEAYEGAALEPLTCRGAFSGKRRTFNSFVIVTLFPKEVCRWLQALRCALLQASYQEMIKQCTLSANANY